MRYNKLVRDKIPDIILSRGGKPKIRKATGEELNRVLFFKINEEVAEFAKAKKDNLSVQEMAEELADISEVVRKFSRLIGSSPEEVERLRAKKELEKGGFENGVILEEA